jgi:hypothetical protein
MSICEKCGAVAEGGSTCPRCGAALPANRSAKALARASSVIAAICLVSAAVDLGIDLSLHGRLGWSLIGLASSALGWMLIGFPMLVYRRPALFLAAMGAAILAYLWVLDGLTGATGWFLSLGLPIALAVMASGALAAFLSVKARRRGPNVGAFILISGTIACLALEGILSLHFRGRLVLTWSAIVAVSALPVAILLLGIQQRLRQPDPLSFADSPEDLGPG